MQLASGSSLLPHAHHLGVCGLAVLQGYDTLFVGRVIIGIILAVAVLAGLVGVFLYHVATPVYAKPLNNID